MPMTRGRKGSAILNNVVTRSRPARHAKTSDQSDLRVVDDATRNIGDVLLSLSSSTDGLHRLQAAVHRGKFGLNEVAHERAPRWYIQLIHSFHNPFIYLLMTLAIVSFLTGDLKAAVIIAVMVLISVGLRFVQEFRSFQAAERLQAMVGTTATVSRPGPRITATLPLGEEPCRRNPPRHPPKREEVPIKLLVPGDVIHLSAGDMVPADVLVLSAKDLFVSQSILTGESHRPADRGDPRAGDRTEYGDERGRLACDRGRLQRGRQSDQTAVRRGRRK
jgi:Mg2+-importing ATPase